jgi:hypothetical protein
MSKDARIRQAPGTDAEPSFSSFSAPTFSAPYAPPDPDIAARLLATAPRPPAAEARINRRATGLIEAIRRRTGGLGGIEDFLHRNRDDGEPPSALQNCGLLSQTAPPASLLRDKFVDP